MSVSELQLTPMVHSDSIYATDPAVKSFIDWKFPGTEQIIDLPFFECDEYSRLRVLGAVIASQVPFVIAMAGSELSPSVQKILVAGAKAVLGAIGMRCDYEVMFGIFRKKPDTLPE